MQTQVGLEQYKEFSQSFLLRKSHRLPDGKHPIVLRIVYCGVRKELFTGQATHPQFWQSKFGFVANNTSDSHAINKELMRISNKVDEIFQNMKITLGEFTIVEFIDQIKGKPKAPLTIMEYIEDRMVKLEKQVGVNVSKVTFYKYRRTAKYFKEFLLTDRKLENLPVSRIDKDLLEAFFNFLRKEKGNCHNSSSALMSCLKSILEEPVKAGIIRYNPFINLPLTRKQVNRVYLTIDEIKSLQGLTDLSESLERNRDLFLFACFTGLAYADIKALKRTNIIVEPDGSKHIESYRTKSTVLSYIPLLKSAETILLKYSPTEDCRDFLWYVSSNQKLNASLKIIGKLAGIDRNLFMHLARHTFATTITLSQGISIESVSKMLGHTTLKHTQLYAKIVNSKVKAEMDKLKNSFGNF